MRIVAIVEYAHRQSGESVQWCRLRPCLRFEGGEWRAVTDRASEFPKQGLVFWYRPDPRADVDTMWDVELTDNARSEERDDYAVERGVRVAGFVPVALDGPTLRRSIADGQFHLIAPPPGPVYLARPGRDSEWLGPFSFEPDRTGRRWVAAKAPTGFVDVVSVPEEHLVHVEHPLVGLRILRPARPRPRAIECWSVQDDSTLLASLLKNIRRLDPRVAHALSVTQRAWREYAETVANVGDDDDVSHDLARVEAVRELLEHHQEDLANNDALFKVLLEHPRIRIRVEEVIDEHVRTSKAEVEKRVEEQLADLLAKHRKAEEGLEVLTTQAREGEERIQRLRKEAHEAEAAIDELQEKLEHRMRETVEAITQDPVSTLLDHVVVRALVNAGSTQDHLVEVASPSPKRVEDAPVEQWDEVLRLVKAEVLTAGLDMAVGLSILAGWLSGRVVTCQGADALRAVLGVGRQVAGSAVWVTPVPAKIFGFEDLMDQRATCAATGELQSLRTLVGQRRGRGYPTVVVLHGANRAPPVHVLEDLVTAVDLAYSRTEGGSDPAATMNGSGGLFLPSGFLWAVTLVEGQTVWKLDRGIACRLHMVDCDRRTPIPVEGRPKGGAAPHRITWPRPMSLDDVTVDDRSPQVEGVEARDVRAMVATFKEWTAAAAELLAARCRVGATEAELTTMAAKLGDGVGEAVDRLASDGVFGRLGRLIEDSDG